MRILNVVEILNGVIHHIESFCIFEEQLSDDVIQNAENYFVEKIKNKNNNISEEELNDAIKYWYWCTDFQEYYDINIVWSEI